MIYGLTKYLSTKNNMSPLHLLRPEGSVLFISSDLSDTRHQVHACVACLICIAQKVFSDPNTSSCVLTTHLNRVQK
jgi:hypothetical protein